MSEAASLRTTLREVPGATARHRASGSPAPHDTGASTLRWRILDTGAGSGARNMALDHALALERREGGAVLRFYRWERPTVSLGRNEPARGRYRLEAAEAEGVVFVRRPTGGRAVLHHRELTYSVVLPLRALDGLRNAYRRINRGLLRGLAGLGAPVLLAGNGGPGLSPSAGPCFRAPVAGEVTLGGRKLVGSAQARVGSSLLQHGSLLLADDQALLGRLRLEGPGETSAPATLKGALGRIPSWEELTEALAGGLEEELGGGWEAGLPRDTEEAAAAQLLEHYGSAEWTWRR